MTVKNARKLRNALLILGFLLYLAGYLYEPLFFVGPAVMLSCLIPDFLYNKCPHCRRHLGRNEGPYCQHCGKQIG